MRFLTYDELTPSMELDRSLIHMSAFGGQFSRRTIELWRRRTKMFAEYVAVFAVEKGHLLGQVFVLRIPYKFPSGTEAICGIAAVATRPDRGRSGVARAIFAEVHRREREAGIRHAALWTNRSWGAHQLYEHLGYRDVYSSPWSVHAAVSNGRRSGGGARVRPARKEDLQEIELLYQDQAQGRLGFYERPEGFLRTAVLAGEVDPAKELLVARNRGQLVGYAHLERNPFRTVCGELVARSVRERRTMVRAVQAAAKGTPFAFQHTVVTDTPQLFPRPQYSSTPNGWYVFMGHRFGRSLSSRESIREFGTEDRRFICLAGDRF